MRSMISGILAASSSLMVISILSLQFMLIPCSDSNSINSLFLNQIVFMILNFKLLFPFDYATKIRYIVTLTKYFWQENTVKSNIYNYSK